MGGLAKVPGLGLPAASVSRSLAGKRTGALAPDWQGTPRNGCLQRVCIRRCRPAWAVLHGQGPAKPTDYSLRGDFPATQVVATPTTPGRPDPQASGFVPPGYRCRPAPIST